MRLLCVYSARTKKGRISPVFNDKNRRYAMNTRFNYFNKTRQDFLKDVVTDMVERRRELGLTQEDLDHLLGVSERQVSKWECGNRTPLAFHLYCWADALQGKIKFVPHDYEPPVSNQNDPEKTEEFIQACRQYSKVS
ncbi:MAG: helix-turn-helix domain-containing protein [Cyclobacteriaceae bacterium]